MLRSQLHPLPEYFDRYILMADDVELLDAIQTSLDELDQVPMATWEALGDQVYAPGKWTLRDLLQHLIDTERIFTYRALAAARGEQQAMISFSEDDYAALVSPAASQRSLEDLLAELKLVHRSFQAMYQTFTPDMLQRNCKGFKGEYSVASIGFMMPGHQRWHFEVLAERYYPLVEVG